MDSHEDTEHEFLDAVQDDDPEDPALKERRMVLKRLKIATVLCVIFFVVEVIGGYLADSIAILSDAAHLFSDLASFAVAIVANYLASLPSTSQHTFGLKRTESLAALFSMITLALVCVWLGGEACLRFYDMVFRPEIAMEKYSTDGKLMSLIATIGVLVNVALAFVSQTADSQLRLTRVARAVESDPHLFVFTGLRRASRSYAWCGWARS